MPSMRSRVLVLCLACARVASAGNAPSPAVRTSAAPGEGVSVSTDDGRFALHLRARAQARVEESWSAAAGRTDEFMIRRMRLSLKGHAFDPHVEFALQLGFATSDLDPDAPAPLRDAYVTFTALRDAHLRVGQMKVPFDRQRVNSSSALQFPDRSLVTQELTLDRDVGVQVFSTDVLGLGHVLGYQLGVFGGDGRNRTNPSAGVLGVARIEWTPFGRFDDDEESDLERRADPKLAIGVGAGFNENTDRPRSTLGRPSGAARFDYRHGEIDGTFKWRGFSTTAAAIVRLSDRDSVDTGGTRDFSRSAVGWFVQAGYLVDPQWELAARYGDLTPVGATDPALVRTRELGLGLNWFLSGHDLKLQTDAFWITGDDLAVGTVQVRSQLQLFF